MAGFRCTKCESIKELKHYKVKVVKGNIVCDDAMCCGVHMNKIRNFSGWGGIIKRPLGTVKGKD